MNFIWRMSLAHLKVTKLRTVLTIAGIVVGTISVLAMTSIGTGVTDYITKVQESDGSIREIHVTSHQVNQFITNQISDSTLSQLSLLPGVEAVYPVNYYDLELRYKGDVKDYTAFVSVIGTTREYLEKMGLRDGTYPDDSGIRPELLAGGAFPNQFTQIQDMGHMNAFYDQELREASFTLTGQNLTARDWSNYDEEFRVRVCGTNQKSLDPRVYTRIEPLIRRMKFYGQGGIVWSQPKDENGNPYPYWIYDAAFVTVKDPDQVENVTREIKNIGYEASNNLEMYSTIKKITDIVMIAFGGIGFIALIVAVIGIINTMSTAIYDRRTEICLLKLLGCDRDDLFALILTESSMIGLTGGLIGLILTILGIHLLINPIAHMLLKIEGLQLARMPLSAAVFVLVGAILISVIAGIYPAHMAEKMRATEVIN